MLSVLAHGEGPRGVAVGRAALAAVRVLESERRLLYTDLVAAFLGPAARAVLEASMRLSADDEAWLKSDFALRIRRMFFGRDMADRRKAVKKGERRGELAGLREALHEILALRGIALGPVQLERVDQCRSRQRLKEWIRRATEVRSARGLFAGSGARGRRVAAQ